MLGDSVWIWMGSNLFGSSRAKLILAPLDMSNEFDPQWTHRECSLFKHPQYLQACTEKLPNMKVLYAEQPNPDQKFILS